MSIQIPHRHTLCLHSFANRAFRQAPDFEFVSFDANSESSWPAASCMFRFEITIHSNHFRHSRGTASRNEGTNHGGRWINPLYPENVPPWETENQCLVSPGRFSLVQTPLLPRFNVCVCRCFQTGQAAFPTTIDSSCNCSIAGVCRRTPHVSIGSDQHLTPFSCPCCFRFLYTLKFWIVYCTNNPICPFRH